MAPMVSFKIPNALLRVPLMIIFLGSFNVAPRCVQNQNQNLVPATCPLKLCWSPTCELFVGQVAETKLK